jgi:hypothetical protein
MSLKALVDLLRPLQWLKNLLHFVERAEQSGGIVDDSFNSSDFLALIQEKIRQLDVASARRDIVRFIKDPLQIEIWSQEYFLQLAQMIKIES